MNKKGFTLVELLAVVAILAVVSLVGMVSVTSVKRKIEANMFEDKLKLALSAAKNWGQDNKDSLSNNTMMCGADYVPCQLTSFQDLIIAGYLEPDEIDDSDPSNIKYILKDHKGNNLAAGNLAIIIRVYSKNNRIYSCVTKLNIADDDLKSIVIKYKCANRSDI